MKFLKFLLIGFILTSCSFNNKEIIILKTLDQFDTQEENERLGSDILNYRFPVFLQQEFPNLTQEEFNNITWQYFIRESDKQVSFRLILSNNILSKKDQIVEFFEKTVNEQVEKHVEDKELFLKAVELTKKNLEFLDNHEYDLFKENSSELMEDFDSFIETLKGRDGISEIGGERIYHSKQYYNSFPNTNETDFYVVNFTFENDKNIMEQITFHLENNELKIAGYTYRVPN